MSTVSRFLDNGPCSDRMVIPAHIATSQIDTTYKDAMDLRRSEKNEYDLQENFHGGGDSLLSRDLTDIMRTLSCETVN